MVGITFLYRSVPDLLDRYLTIHQWTWLGTSRVQSQPSSGRAWMGNLGSRFGRVDLIGSGNVALATRHSDRLKS